MSVGLAWMARLRALIALATGDTACWKSETESEAWTELATATKGRRSLVKCMIAVY